MIPIRDDNPQILRPYATYGIIALNAFAWIFVQGMGVGAPMVRSLCYLGLIPIELMQTIPPNRGVEFAPGFVCELSNASAWYAPITSMFMHGGWMHIIGNMWFMHIFGGNVEDAMGTRRFVVFYLLCGLIAAAAQVAANPDSFVPMVGASGAIGGVMGAYVMLYPRVHVHMFVFLGLFATMVAVPAVLMLGYWFALQFFSGILATGGQGGVAFWAHVGGFVGGMALVLLFRNKRLLQRHPYYGWRRSPTRSWHRIDRR